MKSTRKSNLPKIQSDVLDVPITTRIAIQSIGYHGDAQRPANCELRTLPAPDIKARKLAIGKTIETETVLTHSAKAPISFKIHIVFTEEFDGCH